MSLNERITQLLLQFKQANLIRFDGETIKPIESASLQILSEHLHESRLRYHCVLTLLAEDLEQSDADLLAASKTNLLGNSIEPFDEKVINVFIKQLDRTNLEYSQVYKLLALLSNK